MSRRVKSDSPEGTNVVEAHGVDHDTTGSEETRGGRRYDLRSVGSSTLAVLCEQSSQVESLSAATLVRGGEYYSEPGIRGEEQERPSHARQEGKRRYGAQLKGNRNHDDSDRPSDGPENIEKQTVATSTTGLECLLSSPDERRDPTPVLGCRQPTQWRSTETTLPMEVMLNNTLQALANLIKPQPVRYRSTGPWFEGNEWEDPEEFLRKIESYCDQEGYCQEEWTLVAADRLRGDARRWFDEYKPLYLTFEEFGQHFLEKYDNIAERSRLQAKLFGQQQGQEEAGIFISRKVALYKRLSINISEQLMVQQIKEMLTPEVRMVLRGSTIHTISRLTELAIATERDLVQINRRYACASGNNNPNNRGRTTENQIVRRSGPSTPGPSNAPPYPCRYCGGNHYNRDCPNRRAIEATPASGIQTTTRPTPSENSRRAVPPVAPTVRPNV